VALGRALARDASVYLLDEPLSGLDGPLRSDVRDDLIRLHREINVPMIYVTHDQAECLAMGDRVAVMDRGRVVQVGTPREVYERPASRFVATFLGSPPASVLAGNVSGDGASVHFGSQGDRSGPAVPIPPGRWAALIASRPGGRVEVAVRPEHVTVGHPGEGFGPSFIRLPGEAEVSRLEYLGHETAAHLSWAAFRAGGLIARVPSTSPIRPGDRLAVAIDLERASWFDADTGLALAPSPATLI
jgi:ABC-type sugar transport system ATPase subunit